MMKKPKDIRISRTATLFPALAVILTGLVALGGCGGEVATPTPTPSPTPPAPLTEAQFRGLLSAEDVQEAVGTTASLTTRFLDYKRMAQEVAPEQVVNMDSFFGLGFETDRGTSGITLTIIDFDSVVSMKAHFTDVQSQTGAETMNVDLGDAAFGTEPGGGIAVFTFAKGDRMVQLFSSAPPGEQSLTDLDGLIELARVVDSRL